MQIFFLVLLYLLSLNIQSGSAAETKSCRIIARVIESADPKFQPGEGLCQGDKTVFSGNVVMGCTVSAQQAFSASSAADALRCVDSNNRSSQQVSVGRGDFKGKPELIRPIGPGLSKPLSSLEWASVSGADFYRINLIGTVKFKQWEGRTQGTSIIIPEIKLEPTTQVLIEAVSQDKVISYSQSTFNLLDVSDLRKLNQYIAKIYKYKISQNEKDNLIVSVYQLFGLSDDALNYVKHRLNVNPKNSALKNLYFELISLTSVPIENSNN